MPKTFHFSTAILLSTVLAGPVLAQTADTPIIASPPTYTCPGNALLTADDPNICMHTDSLDQLIADFETAALTNDPITAGDEGDKVARRKLPNVGPEMRALERAQLESLSQRHTSLRRTPDFNRLSRDARLNYDLIGFLLEQRRRVLPFDESRIPFVNDSGFFNNIIYISRQTQFETVEDFGDYAARLTELPRYFVQNRENMRRGITDDFTASADILPGIIETVRQMADADIEDHPLFAPFLEFPESISLEDQIRLTALGQAAIATSVKPAYQNLLVFLEDEYAPAARETVGIGTTEDGRNYYRALVRNYTTLNLTPDEVHEIGLREVARIRNEMDAVIQESGFAGSFADFLEFLRTDPQFYAQSEDELLKQAAWLAKRIDGKMPEFFGKLPRLPYGVMKVPDEIAKNYTTGRYWGGSLETNRAGFYVVNTYDLPMRPLYNLPALTAHEGVPGHHHQIALAQELSDLPDFRKSLYATAFGEGWGLYSEKLVAEMGLYDTPYEKFGQLTYEMWRACRLVVDTGMHWKGWSREQAEACFLENSALSESNIRTEVDRYISWPGQALAYKIGELKILELRERAKRNLGDNFNIREFHDAVLENGSLPLSILERQIDLYVGKAKRDSAQARSIGQ